MFIYSILKIKFMFCQKFEKFTIGNLNILNILNILKNNNLIKF